MLNEGTGLILCHLRKVACDESDSAKSKRAADNASSSHATPKKAKYETPPQLNPTLPTTANMGGVELAQGSGIELRRRGVLLDSVERGKVWDGYLGKSRRLIRQIAEHGGKKYQDLYRTLLQDE